MFGNGRNHHHHGGGGLARIFAPSRGYGRRRGYVGPALREQERRLQAEETLALARAADILRANNDANLAPKGGLRTTASLREEKDLIKLAGKIANDECMISDLHGQPCNALFTVDALTTTLLHVAVRCQRRPIVSALIERGAYLNVIDSTGEPALVAAVKTGNEDIVDVLIDAGADTACLVADEGEAEEEKQGASSDAVGAPTATATAPPEGDPALVARVAELEGQLAAVLARLARVEAQLSTQQQDEEEQDGQ